MTTASTATDMRANARWYDLFASEWLKLRSLRSARWSSLIGALAVLAFNVFEAQSTVRSLTPDDAQAIASGLPLLDAYSTNAGIVAAGALGAAAISSEFSNGLIRVTFTAVPARRSVMAAKLCVLGVVATVLGAVVAVVSFTVTQAVLAGRHANASIAAPGAVRVLVASSLLVPVCALVGAAIGALVRHSAGAVAAAVVVLQVVPGLVNDHHHWSAVITHLLPFEAWVRLVATAYDLSSIAYPWSMTGAWIVLAVWTAAAVVLALVSVGRRDV